MFWTKNKKNRHTPTYSSFTIYYKWGHKLRGYSLYGHVFLVHCGNGPVNTSEQLPNDFHGFCFDLPNITFKINRNQTPRVFYLFGQEYLNFAMRYTSTKNKLDDEKFIATTANNVRVNALYGTCTCSTIVRCGYLMAWSIYTTSLLL